MVTVHAGGGMGYAATSDLSLSGLRRAAERAHDWAKLSARRSVIDFAQLIVEPPHGEYSSVERQPWSSVPLSEKIDLLRGECARLKTDDRIVDWETSLWHTAVDTLYLTADGGQVEQRFRYLVPMLSATANAGAETRHVLLAGEVLPPGAAWDPRTSASIPRPPYSPGGRTIAGGAQFALRVRWTCYWRQIR
jgi:predicted Zn-dependent protease